MAETAQSIIPETHLDLLQATGFAHVATIGPSGAPQVNPLGYLWDGTHLRFVTPSTSQKVRNLQRDPRIAASIIDAANPARYLEIRGVLARVDPDPDQRFRQNLLRRYGREETGGDDLSAEEWVVLTVEPRRVTHHG